MDLSKALSVARGDEPAGLVLRNARVVDVFSGEVLAADVALAGPLIAGVGLGYGGREEVDLGGRFVCPGFIDAHVHLESSLVTPWQYARAVVPRGVTTVIANPHEIANVLGAEGVRWMLAAASGSPLSTYLTVPSSVPATRLATAGAALGLAQIRELLAHPSSVGLGEVMGCTRVAAGDPELLEELRAAEGRRVDGHAPGLSGRMLAAYALAGPSSDHECTTAAEALERCRLGMAVFAREGTAAKDLRPLLAAVTPRTERRFCLCTDDRQPADLVGEGSIDHLVRLASSHGLDPVTAVRLATLNPTEHFGLRDRGAVAPGRRADLVVFSRLEEPRAEEVYCAGRLVAREGRPLEGAWGGGAVPRAVARDTVRVSWREVCLAAEPRGGRVRAIVLVPDQIATGGAVVELPTLENRPSADPRQDVTKLAVIGRHGGPQTVGIGFVKGFGLVRGALASTVCHDHHNLIAVGADDRSMLTAARAAAAGGGGQAVAVGDEVVAELRLPLAGLLSEEPLERVATQALRLRDAARELGAAPGDPFVTLSFLGLEVVPSLKLTDLGLIDVEAQAVISLFED